MPDFEKMYYHLFNAITDALSELDAEQARAILMQAQCETEEMYIEAE